MLDYDSEEISQKLSNYKIPLKQSSSSMCKDSGDGSADGEECQQNLQSEVTFSSPLLNDELSNEIITSHIEYSRQQSFGSSPTKQSNNDQEIFPRKRKHETGEKPMFFGRDPSYPTELNELIQPLFCSLCNAHLNSIKTSRVHYESKSHDKKITNWLNDWSQKTGESVPKVKRFVKDGPTGPDAFHCEECDLPLTSLQHANQHYNGKRHKMVVARKADPSGSGFYNNEGKWVRQATKVSKDCSPRFGIGESFIKSGEVSEPPEKQDPSKYCALCNISVTSSQQMEMHLSGTKHAKKLKQQGQPPPPPPQTGETILESISYPQNNDISMYRTPSGSYYCEICNITLTDVALFQQHLSSKKHTKNTKAKATEQQQNGKLSKDK